MRLFVILLILMQSVFSQTVRLGQDTTEPKVVVSGADYKVNVCGPLTEINATITVYNQDRNEERVTFFYKLPDEATVTGFALDINGKMRRASAVEKHKARIAFETEVRGKIDPALIEWNQGNVFQTQIYPVEGNGIRKVTVSYIIPTSDLIEIPLQFQKLNQFNFTVSSPDPVSVGGPAEMLKLTNSDNSYVELRAEGSAVEGAFKIKLSGEKNKLYAEKNKDKSLYWIYKEPLSLPAEQVSFANTGSIAVYQDISLSRDSADLQKETDFLMGLVKHIGKPVTVELYRFHVSSKFYKKYTVGSDDSFNEFAQDYHNCTVDGGTDFSKLTPLLKSCKADMKIFFSDGLNNYSNFSGSEKVFTINSSSEIDSFALRNLGQRNINLNGVSTSEALQIFITKPLLIKSDTADTFGEVKNGWLTVTGKLKPREKAEFAIYQGSIQLREITVKPERITDSNIVRKYWSLKKLHSLMNDRLKNKNGMMLFCSS